MSELAATAEDVQKIIARSPYLSWLGLKVLSLGVDTIELRATWREEWVANPSIGQTQGGILASLIDVASDYALMGTLGRPVPTIDLRVDYHRLATKGDLTVKGTVVKAGKQLSVCDAQIFDDQGRLVASGRGAFFTAPPAPRGG